MGDCHVVLLALAVMCLINMWDFGLGSVEFMMETNSSLCRLCGMPFMPFVVGVVFQAQIVDNIGFFLNEGEGGFQNIMDPWHLAAAF